MLPDEMPVVTRSSHEPAPMQPLMSSLFSSRLQMRSRVVLHRTGVALWSLVLLGLHHMPVTAEASADKKSLLFSEAIVRETLDQDWTLRLRGTVPSLAGCYVLVHDSAGNLLIKRHIPHGEYREGHPLELTVPKNGRVGDYRIVVVGREADVRGFGLPLTDLQFEVYGHSLFATRSQGPLWFQAQPGSAQQKFSGTSGEVRVLREMQPVAGPLEPGQIYALDTSKTFYFSANPGVFLSFSPERTFIPEAKIQEIAWWRLTGIDRIGSPAKAGFAQEVLESTESD